MSQYRPIIRNHLYRILDQLPTVSPKETMLFLDNIEYLLNHPSAIESHTWRSATTSAAGTPVFNLHDSTDFPKLVLQIDDLSTRDPGQKSKGHRARIILDGYIWIEGRAAATVADAMSGLYEATNDLAERFGGGRKWYVAMGLYSVET